MPIVTLVLNAIIIALVVFLPVLGVLSLLRSLRSLASDVRVIAEHIKEQAKRGAGGEDGSGS